MNGAGTGSDQVELSQETAASRGLVALFVWPALLSKALFSLSSLVLKEQR
jgi:hypothetical protein